MTQSHTPPPRFFRPFLFVLQEGKEIKKDLMDFRLVLLDIRCREIVPSPRRPLISDTKEPPLVSTERLISEIEKIARKTEKTQSGSDPAKE